jgi:hypothetical protein
MLTTDRLGSAQLLCENVAAIISSMTLQLTGLEMKSSVPAAKQRSRSSLIADAVMARIGT